MNSAHVGKAVLVMIFFLVFTTGGATESDFNPKKHNGIKRNIITVSLQGKGAAKLDYSSVPDGFKPLTVEVLDDGTEIWHCHSRKDLPRANWSSYILMWLPKSKKFTVSHDLYIDFDLKMDMDEDVPCEISGLLAEGLDDARRSYTMLYWSRTFLTNMHVPVGKKNPQPWKSGEWMRCTASLAPGALRPRGRSVYAKMGDAYYCVSIYIDLRRKAKTDNIQIKNLHIYNKYDISMDNINAIDEYGFSKFHYFCMAGDTKLMKKAIESGAEVNAVGDYMQKPIHFATVSGNTKAVELLLKQGADVNSSSWHKFGRPLYHAIGMRDEKVVRMLLKHGADPRETIENHDINSFVKERKFPQIMPLINEATKALKKKEAEVDL